MKYDEFNTVTPMYQQMTLLMLYAARVIDDHNYRNGMRIKCQ